MQSNLVACTFTKRHTKQIPKSSSGVGHHLPADKETHAHPEELAPQKGTRPARIRTPELMAPDPQRPISPPVPHHPNTSFGYSSGAWTSLTLPSWGLPGSSPSLCQGEDKIIKH